MFNSLFEAFICVQYFFDVATNQTSNKKYLIQFIKRRSKKSWEEYITWTYFKFWPMINICRKLKPIRIWLWLVYRIIENICHSGLYAELIQTQKKYLTAFDKANILTWRLNYQIKLKLSLWTKRLENLLLYALCPGGEIGFQTLLLYVKQFAFVFSVTRNMDLLC